MKIHPIAECYPPLSATQRAELKNSIQAIGLQNPIVLYEGQILDGVHRWQACQELGIEPQFVSPKINDPFAIAIAQNETRRQMDNTDRAIVAEKLATLKNGTNRFTRIGGSTELPTPGTREAIAQKLGTSIQSLQRVRQVKTHGAPELVQAMETKQIGLQTAAAISMMPKTDQPEAVESVKQGKPRKTPKGKQEEKPPKETRGQLMERMLRPGMGSKPLTRKEIDPDFVGTEQDWVDKYGHVQLRTKVQIEIDKELDTFSAWIGAIRDLRKPLEEYLKIGRFKPETFDQWISKAPNKEKRLTEVRTLVSMITQTKESVDWLQEQR